MRLSLRRLLPWTAGCLLTFFYAFFIQCTAFEYAGRTCFSLFDDAMISMTYARNLASGEGLVWFPGEGAVEGYTNFMWTLWMAFLHLLGLGEEKVSLLVMLTGIPLLLLTSLAVMQIAKRLSDAPWLPLAAFVLTGAHFGLIFWTLRGMEVGLIAFLCSFLVLKALEFRESEKSGTFFQLMLTIPCLLLTRTDTLIPVGLVILWLVWRLPAKSRWKWTGSLLLIAGLTLLGHSLFRLAYYGELLPNTYYLKVAGIPLEDRLLRGLHRYSISLTMIIPILFPTLLAGLLRPSLFREPNRFLPGVIFLTMSAYSIFVGGDAWEWMPFPNRYLSIALPLLTLLGLLSIQDIAKDWTGSRRQMLLTGSFLGVTSLALVLGGKEALMHVNGFSVSLVFLFFGTIIFSLFNSRRLSRKVLFGGIVGGMLLAQNFDPLLGFFENGPIHASNDARWARTGLTIRDQSQPTLTIAVVWAGAIPYFSQRKCYDLLGKNDRKIARSTPKGRLIPGHNKWDYAYHLGVLRPDLIQMLWFPTKEEEALVLGEWGYRKMKNDMFAGENAEQKVALDRVEAVK